MGKDLQKIDQKIDKLAEQVGAVVETLSFIKDRVAKTEDHLNAFEEKTDMKFKMTEGHLNVIEQKLDTHLEKHKDLEVRVTRLESAPAQ